MVYVFLTPRDASKLRFFYPVYVYFFGIVSNGLFFEQSGLTI